MATLQTYTVVGMAEDVSATIANISPTSTPFQSLIKSEKVHARTFEFMEDSIRAAGVNALVEGADASTITIGEPTLRSNTTQIIGEAFKVAATVDAIKTHGRAKETAYALAKTLKALKLDVEKAYIGVDQAVVAGNASTGRKMASASNMISTGLDAGSDATNPLTEAKLLTAGQTAYTNGSDVDTLMIKTADAQIVAGFSAASGRNREIAQGKTLVNAIDLYVEEVSVH